MTHSIAKPSMQELCIAVEEMDQVAGGAFNGIQAVAALLLATLKNPQTCLNTDVMAHAIQVIHVVASDAADKVNCSADAVGCNFVDDDRSKRWTARYEAMLNAGS